MLQEHEILAIFKSSKIHWTVKARMIQNCVDQNITMNRNQLAFKFHTTEPIISEYLQLAKAIKQFPTLSNIPTKLEALQLLKITDNPIKLREIIRVTALKYKSELLLKEIKNAITTFKSSTKQSGTSRRKAKFNFGNKIRDDSQTDNFA